VDVHGALFLGDELRGLNITPASEIQSAACLRIPPQDIEKGLPVKEFLKASRAQKKEESDETHTNR
jgi:hypothetical protein